RRLREDACSAQRPPFKRDKSRGFFNPALQLCAAFKRRLLGADQTENNGPVFRNLRQWFKATGTFVVVLEQEALKFSFTKDLRDRTVVTSCVELALVISPAKVQAEDDSGMITDNRVVHLDRESQKSIGIVPTAAVPLPQLWIEERGVLRR